MSALHKVCLVVTGASRGFGRAAAITFCRDLIGYGQDSSGDSISSSNAARQVHAVLVARSALGLQETENEILRWYTEAKQRKAGQHTAEVAQLTISKVVADLSDLNTLDGTVHDILKQCNALLSSTQHQEAEETSCRIIFINNAGSLGHVGLCTDTPSLMDLQQAIDFNVTSSLWMSLKIKQWVAGTNRVSARIVNISSLCALQPIPTMAVYSAGKAARDAYHSAMAQEHMSCPVTTAAATTANTSTATTTKTTATTTKTTATTTGASSAMTSPILSDDRLRILNYAPGPLETDMAKTLRFSDTLDAAVQSHFRLQLVDPMDSAAVLSRLVRDDTMYANGAHVDYYDCLT